MRIKNTKKNIFYLIVGRIITFITIYGLTILVGIKILEYIVNNCITTIK